MSMPVNLNPRLRRTLGLPLLVLLSACATIGTGSVNRDRLDYAEALANSWKEQMLLNFRSKAAFIFLLLLTSLAQTGAVPQAPVITCPRAKPELDIGPNRLGAS